MKRRTKTRHLKTLRSNLNKSQPKGKFTLKLTIHAKRRLLERFGLRSIACRVNEVQIISKINENRLVYLIKDRNIIFIRNRASKKVITFLTPEMWQNQKPIDLTQECKDNEQTHKDSVVESLEIG